MMSFAANLARARSHLIIVFGLISASALIMSIEATTPGRVATSVKGRATAPTSAETRAATWAWANLPPSQRTTEMRSAAARLGVRDARSVRLGSGEAAAILRALDKSHGDQR